MKIIESKNGMRYYDVNGKEIHDGDNVSMDGRVRRVYKTEDGELGTDATNPAWIESGRAEPCAFGIYPFSPYDEPEIVE